VVVLVVGAVGCRGQAVKPTVKSEFGYSKSTRVMKEFEATGTLAEYEAAGEAMRGFMESRLALPAGERFAAALELLGQHRDVQNSRFRKRVIAVFDRHGWPVAEEVRRVRVEVRRKTSAADVVASRVVATLLIDKPRDKTASQMTAELIPYAVWNDLKEVVAWYCPDRRMRFDAVFNSSRPSDVAAPDPGRVAYAEDVIEADQAASLKDFLASFANREGDGINISVVTVCMDMLGTTFAGVFYCYGMSLPDPDPRVIHDAAQRLRVALVAAAKFDASPDAQELIDNVIKTIDEGDERFRKMERKLKCSKK